MHKRDREIIRRYKRGKTLDEVAAEFELSPSGVAVVLERHHVKRRRRGKPLKLTADWVWRGKT